VDDAHDAALSRSLADLRRHLQYGYDVGQQSDIIFASRFETILHLPPAETR
jgi:hypothetical protein